MDRLPRIWSSRVLFTAEIATGARKSTFCDVLRLHELGQMRNQ